MRAVSMTGHDASPDEPALPEWGIWLSRDTSESCYLKITAASEDEARDLALAAYEDHVFEPDESWGEMYVSEARRLSPQPDDAS